MRKTYADHSKCPKCGREFVTRRKLTNAGEWVVSRCPDCGRNFHKTAGEPQDEL